MEVRLRKIPTPPIKIAAKGEGIKGSAVIATNPPIHPFSICTTSVLPDNLVTAAAAITPPAPANNVFINIFDTAIASLPVPIASCDPPLNPNHPNQSMNVPIVAKGKFYPGIAITEPLDAYLPSLGPMIIAPVNAAQPPTE